MQKKKVAVIGYGYVGKAVAAFFKDHYEVVLYDPPQGHADKDAVNSSDLAVVCVPTPMGDGGVCDTSIVEETFGWLKTPLILLKSTVPPGTTAALIEKHGLKDRLVSFSPEYLGEGNYPVPYWKGLPHPTDMKLHSFFVFGGERAVMAKVIAFFQKVAGAHAKYAQTDPTTAELTKYMVNSWLATKVTFANEFYGIAQSFGVDYNELREIFLLDGRTEPSHTLVYPDNRGFGGKCLPKDVNGIVKATEKAGYLPTLLQQILKTNEDFRRRIRF